MDTPISKIVNREEIAKVDYLAQIQCTIGVMQTDRAGIVKSAQFNILTKGSR
jgi:hypothetical protein